MSDDVGNGNKLVNLNALKAVVDNLGVSDVVELKKKASENEGKAVISNGTTLTYGDALPTGGAEGDILKFKGGKAQWVSSGSFEYNESTGILYYNL